MGLKKYVSKRNFNKTREPRGQKKKSQGNLIFVVQKHHARRLHYDFRLEYEGTLKSWAVPKGPSYDPKDKRLAVEVEDHPIEYARFEGDIPPGEYGAGHVAIWDSGTWTPPENAKAALKKGHLDFELHGKKLKGHWSLIRLRTSEKGKNNWLLFKRKDNFKLPEKIAPKRDKKISHLPKFIKPQLAQLVKTVPTGEDWLHEIKFDGYRTMSYLENGKARLITRRGLDWTDKYGPLSVDIEKLNAQNAIIDGELVCLDENGHSDFQKLQNAISEGNFKNMVYYVFDLLFLNGQDLRGLPLLERKELLKKLIAPLKGSSLVFSEHWRNQGAAILKQSCKLGLEGIVSKQSYAEYFSGRNEIWQKTKCSLRQEFIIAGYTQSPSQDRPFGALILGVYENDSLKYVGRVGTGFTEKTFQELNSLFKKLKIDFSAFSKINFPTKSIKWLKPQLIAEIEFKSWTQDKVLRQASFKGLRSDKETKEVHIDVKITHPDRILYPSTKTTKANVVNYYNSVAPFLLPFVKDRPLSILRCQNKAQGGCYFQKHSQGQGLIGIESKPVHYKDKKDTAITIQSQTDLIEIIQAGTVEVHSWNGCFSHITRPDQIVFDLDPESIKMWSETVETAHLIKEMLDALRLRSFVKVTGGKGLHIHVPIRPHFSWDQVKLFSKSLMLILQEQNPQLYTTNMIKKNRHKKIFLDYLRNGYGATAVVPYSLRAREEPTVALPISWKEVKNSLSPEQFIYSEVLKIIKKRKDPWEDYWHVSQQIKMLKKTQDHSIQA